ncbi:MULTISPECIES: Z1 domain-containing protein [Streptomyces]|uniref:Z1 domain-containing protein n=1 Tax=Streptomyces TaxID=1883 RepID=UPI001F51F276|nr:MULTISPECIES: Z1 domain-containing protein [unclassified Streptomyces]
MSVTARGEQGDFSLYKTLSLRPPVYPRVFVIKKNRRIVDRVRDWLTHTSQPEDRPTLVIDTTGDARGTLSSPSKVDESVERLLSSCPRVGYVGYTYMSFLTTSQVLPDFIYHVPKLPGHFGPEQLFTDTEQPLPLVRTVFDQDRWLPPGHRADHVPGRELPDSLFTALKSFVLACAARRVRDRKRTSNSMLVSLSRFVAVQKRVGDQLAERVGVMAGDLRDRRGPRGQRLMAEFEELWRQDFVPTSEAIADAAVPAVPWKQVADQLTNVAQQLVVVTANSASDMTPHLHESEYGGLNIVAVGGAKPAQGLPLEGLTTSYCLRAPANYETLRLLTTPFGPHTGYQDLCRLYATLEVLDTQHRLTARINGQREELQELAGLDITPAQAVLRVRATHSPGRSWETLDFTLVLERVRQNFRTLEAFIRSLGRAGTSDSRTAANLLWHGVTPAKIAEFLDAYLPGSEPSWNRLAEICRHLRRGVGLGGLGDWTVQLVSPPKSPVLVEVAGHRVGTVRRALLPRGNEDGFRIRRLSAVGNEYADLDPGQYLRAIEATRSAVAVDPARPARRHEPTRPSRAAVEAVRRPDQALLLSTWSGGRRPSTARSRLHWWDWPYPCHTRPRCPSPPPRSAERRPRFRSRYRIGPGETATDREPVPGAILDLLLGQSADAPCFVPDSPKPRQVRTSYRRTSYPTGSEAVLRKAPAAPAGRRPVPGSSACDGRMSACLKSPKASMPTCTATRSLMPTNWFGSPRCTGGFSTSTCTRPPACCASRQPACTGCWWNAMRTSKPSCPDAICTCR